MWSVIWVGIALSEGLPTYDEGRGDRRQRYVNQNLADVERAEIVRLRVYIMLKSRVDAHRGVLGTSEVSRKRDFKPSTPTCLGRPRGNLFG